MAVRIGSAEFDSKVLGVEGAVLVDFYSDGCVACKMLAPVIGDIEDDYEAKLTVYKVNATFDGALAEKYRIMSTPTLILFENGEEKGRLYGAKKKAELVKWLEENAKL